MTDKIVKENLIASELQVLEAPSSLVDMKFLKPNTLSESDKAILDSQLPIMQGKLVENNLRMMTVIRDLMTADQVPESFLTDPLSYIETKTANAIKDGQVAPGVTFNADTFLAMVVDARKKYRNEEIIQPGDVMAVHTSSSTNSYVRSERRTSFTFEKSNITGTEKRAIVSSDTRTTTVTSGRGILDIDMSNVLVRPEVMDQRLENFYKEFPTSQPDLDDLLNPGWTDPIRPDK